MPAETGCLPSATYGASGAPHDMWGVKGVVNRLGTRSLSPPITSTFGALSRMLGAEST